MSTSLLRRGYVLPCLCTPGWNPNISFRGPGRPVLAIEDSGINIGHRCGGNAHCTTCRVTFESGEPDKMTQAEKDILEENGILGEVRLSCQVNCDHDMIVKTHMTLEIEPWDSSGDTPEPQITPDPEWV